MYLSDIHTHSIASGHGTTCTISDMAKAASQKGLKLDLFAQEAFRCGIIIWN